MPEPTADDQAAAQAQQRTYSTLMGFIFVFNLIVGTGALTLPAAFSKAGWLLSSIAILMLAFISYMTMTFVVEAMSSANAVKVWNKSQNSASVYYNLDVKFEMSDMSALFFNQYGKFFFYFCMCIYLYGDLCIYAVAVSKSLRDVVCDHFTNYNLNLKLGYTNMEQDIVTMCWKNRTYSRLAVYRIILLTFGCIFGPFAAFTVHKTKYIQLFTVGYRWFAFFFMITIALKMLMVDGVKGHPEASNFYGTPALFGSCVYSFMCHHSLPSLLTPIRNKLAISQIMIADCIVVCCFYTLLALSGLFAFEHPQDLYTRNFIPERLDEHSVQGDTMVVIHYLLAMFPVFTLSASFPIISITLRNNLQTLFLDMSQFESYHFAIRRIFFPILTVVPPFIITYFYEDISMLVAFTGSYAGTAIQYLIPAALVHFGRTTCHELLGKDVINVYGSPFKSVYWVIFVFLWSAFCIVLVTVNILHKK